MRNVLFAALLAVGLSALSGCSTLMQGSQVPKELEVRPVGRSDAGTPFDVNRKGMFASVSDGAIEITDGTGKPVSIPQGAVSALSFSPDGETLAAALPSETSTMLRLFDGAGKVLGETKVPGRVTSLAWRSRHQLLAGGLTIRKYSFGSSVTASLYQWDRTGTPVATTLNDVTLRPQIARMPEETLYNQAIVSVSPYGDEIAYSSLKDPPLYDPYLSISIRHLDTGAVTEVAKTSLGAGKALYTPDGEHLLIGDARAMTRKVSLPDGKEKDAWPSAGSHPAASPSGSYLFLNGRLYQDGKSLASFPLQTRGVFLPDGTGLALSYQGKLYLLSGLKDPGAPALPADLERLLKLRRLRSQGLISEREYRTQRDKGRAP